MKPEGVITALVTPFDNDKLNLNGLKQNIEYQIECGVNGILVLGTTGESPAMSEQEQESVIRCAVETSGGRCPVYVGTGSNSTEKTIQATKRAKELGADCALIITPYYSRPPQEGIYNHFSAVANAVDLPILLYNHAARTGSNIAVETMIRLAEIPNIVGVKEANNDMNQMQTIIRKIARENSDFTVLSGCDIDTFPTIALGGSGIVSVVSNIVPKQMLQLVQKALSGKMEEARECHYNLLPLFHASAIETNPIPIKTAMKLCGMPAGSCRLPLSEMTLRNREILEKTLEEYGLLQYAL